MSYASQQAMIDRFSETELVQLTDRAGANTIDVAVLQRALDDADAEINGYLASRYTLPLATVPQILVGYASDIARYRLYDDRASEQVTQRYSQAISFLKLLATGKISLGVPIGADPQPSGGGAAIAGDCPTFTRESLKDFNA